MFLLGGSSTGSRNQIVLLACLSLSFALIPSYGFSSFCTPRRGLVLLYCIADDAVLRILILILVILFGRVHEMFDKNLK